MRRRRMRWLGAALAAAAAFFTRAPLAARRLWDHDSVQFALGMEHFDLAAHHPHPPGYPLYMAALELLVALGLAPGAAMVLLSLAAAAAGAAAIFLLVAELASGWSATASGDDDGLAAAVFAAALYVTNPQLWFYGLLPLVYAVEGGLAVVVAYLVVRGSRDRRWLYAAAVAAAVAGGLRPSTLVLLAPLVAAGAWRAWRRGVAVRHLAGAAAVGIALVAAWLVPLLVASGGLAAYRRVAGEHFGALLPVTSVLYGGGTAALAHNLENLAKWAAQALWPGTAVVAALAAVRPAALERGAILAVRRGGWLLVWALPPMLFFALFHVTKAGYTLIYLPALLAGLALAAAPLLEGSLGHPSAADREQGRAPGRKDRGSRRGEAATGLGRRAVVATAAAALLGAALFLLGSERQPQRPRWWALVHQPHNLSALRGFEEELDRALAVIGRWPSESTVLAAVELAGRGGAGAEGFLYPWHRHLQWYAPDYQVVLLVPDEPFALAVRGHRPFARFGTEVPLLPTARQLLVVTAGDPGARFPVAGEVLLDGERFRIVRLPIPSGGLELGPFRLRG